MLSYLWSAVRALAAGADGASIFQLTQWIYFLVSCIWFVPCLIALKCVLQWVNEAVTLVFSHIRTGLVLPGDLMTPSTKQCLYFTRIYPHYSVNMMSGWNITAATTKSLPNLYPKCCQKIVLSFSLRASIFLVLGQRQKVAGWGKKIEQSQITSKSQRCQFTQD